MIRRKTMIRIRKFIIIFFALLLVFIWCNHNSSIRKESHVESVTFVKVIPTSQASQEILPLGKPNDRLLRRKVDSGSLDFLEKYLQVDEDHKSFIREESHVESGTVVKVIPTNQAFQETTPLQNAKDRSLRRKVDFGSLDIHEKYPQVDDDKFNDFEKRKMRLRNPLGRYFVNSSKCSMPYVDPFSSGVLATLEPVKYKTCSKESDFLNLNYDLNLQQYSLHANKEVLSKFLPSKAKMSCHYRGLSDDIDGKALKKSFQQTEALSTKLTGIITECRLAENTSEIFQQDAFPLIQIPNRTSTSDSQSVNKKPSVIILGLDSLSRMNFKRTMPGTSQFVKELGFFEMEGYNKVGDTMFSNLCAIFAGELSGKQCLERYPLLWKKFKEAGYITAFAEDILRSSISVQTPSDYELRSFLTQIAESMSIYRKFGIEYCIGRRLSLSYLYDFCMQFTERIIEELDHPAFGLFWSSSLTRNYPLGAISLDDKFMEYLELMRKHKVFERSIVILVSDQGQKESDFVKLPNAFLEERLPMLHIYLPEWFLIAYPKYAENLHLNRNRLTSPFDLHNTLNHILSLNTSNPNELSPLQYCSTCQSLFHLVPQNRSCDEAGIGMNWCACNEFVPLPNDDRSYFLGRLLVFHINKWMVRRRFNRFCQRLQLLELDYVEEAISNDDGQEGTYSLRIRTFPIQGVFEATIRYREDLNDFIDLRMSNISSMINYHKHSMCINDKMAKKFCFCYPEKLNENMKVWKSLKRKKFAKQTSSFPSENVTLENPLIPFLDQS